MENLSDFNQKLKKALTKSPKEPYISMNKLSEYMQADSLRRRSIIKLLKIDKAFAYGKYTLVRNMLSLYFKNNYDLSIIDRHISEIQRKLKVEGSNKEDLENVLIAFKHLKEIELPNIDDYKIIEDEIGLDSINLAGMKVLIRPDIMLKHTSTNKIGAVKFHIIKDENNRLSKKCRQYAATLIKYALIQKGLDEKKQIDDNFCISVDLFEEEFDFSPKTYKNSVYALTAACEEIFSRWDSV